MVLETRLTRLLGIKHPIIAGCMQRVSRAEFVAAAHAEQTRRRLANGV